MQFKSDERAKEMLAEKDDMSELERLIFKELPETLSDNAPPNFAELYSDFTQEYEWFRNYILYDKLIGKNTAALGGSFSSGKTTFLNSLFDHEILPVNTSPSAQVPAYLAYGDDISVYGTNNSKSLLSIEPEQLPAVFRSFGKTDGDAGETTLGNILESIFISSPHQSFKNIALLDTPGYSAAESPNYSAKTDEKTARIQLNSANYILWFVRADAGTITDEDISFLCTVNKDIPRLIIVSMADKVPPEELAVVVKKIRLVLKLKAVPFVDVLTYSREKNIADDREKIIGILGQWNNEVCESRFEYNFKEFFTNCKEFYDNRINEENQRLNRLNEAAALAADDAVSKSLASPISEIKRGISNLRERRRRLRALQNKFFPEIKRVCDMAQTAKPKPSGIGSIRDKTADAGAVTDEYREKRSGDLQLILTELFENINPIFNSIDGNGGLDLELVDAVAENLNIPAEKVRFNKLDKKHYSNA